MKLKHENGQMNWKAIALALISVTVLSVVAFYGISWGTTQTDVGKVRAEVNELRKDMENGDKHLDAVKAENKLVEIQFTHQQERFSGLEKRMDKMESKQDQQLEILIDIQREMRR